MERKKEFTSTEEVFAALSPEIREHSLRVEKYADLIFMELCASEEYTINIHSRVRLRGDNRTLVGLAARYHDLGKALVPEFYQWNEPEYTPEEYALYCRHCLAGDELVHHILQNQKGIVPMTVDVICESIAYHHECWDGSGFPHGTGEEHIPIVGRIVAVANALDHLLMTTRTETPVATVIDRMMQDSASLYDPVIMGLLYEAQPKLERIFAQYRGESKAIPQTLRIIRRKKRPMWLAYRPIMSLRDRRVVGAETVMQFRRGKETVTFTEVEPLLRKNKQVLDAGLCFLLEACDAARRMRTCGVGGGLVALPLVPGLLRKRGMATTIAKLLADTETDPASLLLILRPEDITAPTATATENCARLRALGVSLLCDGVPLEGLSLENLSTLQVSHLRLTPADSAALREPTEQLVDIAGLGITILADGVDKHRLITSLTTSGVMLGTGDLLGEYATEDDFIFGELAVRAEAEANA